MTLIEFSESNNNVVTFKINGHTETDIFGKDIVCASISATVLMVINGLVEIKKVKELNYKIEEGYVLCDLTNVSNEDILKSQDLLKSLKLFLKQISKDYPKNVKFRIRRYEK